MFVKMSLYLVNVLVRAFNRTIDWFVGATESPAVIRYPRIIRKLITNVLEAVDRVLLVGRRYLVRVRKTMKYRLYFEAVTEPMRCRYRESKRK
jgi:hypothetical protein